MRWRARGSAAARPPSPHRRFAALCSRRALRALDVVLWLHCCKNVTPAARAFASRFALRLCAAARRPARAVALALHARRCAARHPSIVQRCCAALRARFAGSGSCAAVAARSSRFAGRGRWSVAVATPAPAARVFARSRRCCGSPAGSRSRPHPRPYPALTLNPYPILKVKRFNTPHPPKTEKGILEFTL